MTFIRVAGTDLCVAAGSEYWGLVINSEGSQYLRSKDAVAGSAVILKKCDKTSSEQIWVYEVLIHRFYLHCQFYFRFPFFSRLFNIDWLATIRSVPSLVLGLPNAENGQQLNVQVFDHLEHKQVFHLDSRETEE